MKQLLTAIFCLSVLCCYAQRDSMYCEVVIHGKQFSQKSTINVDYGAGINTKTDYKVKDEKGQPMIFNSTADALNYMAYLGWEVVQMLPAPGSIAGETNTAWLLKRRSR